MTAALQTVGQSESMHCLPLRGDFNGVRPVRAE